MSLYVTFLETCTRVLTIINVLYFFQTKMTMFINMKSFGFSRVSEDERNAARNGFKVFRLKIKQQTQNNGVFYLKSQ